MKIKASIIFILSLFFSLCCFAQASAPASSALSPALNLGGKEWKLRFKDENNDSKIMEYVSNNENISKWTELLTIQKFKFKFPKEITPIAFADKEIANLKEKGYKYVYTTFDSTPQEATIEFRVSSPADQQQDEIQRIVKTADDQLVVLHYAIRKNDMGDTERTKWVSALKGINISGI